MNALKTYSALADELFPALPALGTSGVSRYYQSHGFHRLRWIMPEFAQYLSERHAEYDLSDYIIDGRGADLGPYERQVLGELLLAPQRLVLLVGYAGSGKTSTIRHVLDHYDNNRRITSIFHTPANLEGRIRALRPAYAYIDFNPIWPQMEKLQETGADEKTVTEELSRRWAETFPAQIITMFEKRADQYRLSALSVFLDIIEAAHGWTTGQPTPGKRPFEFKEEINRVLVKLGGSFRKGNREADYARLLDAVQSLRADDQIEYWFGILEAIHVLCRAVDNQETASMFVVCDNADPMDGYLQVHIHRILTSLTQKISFKVVAPVRPTNFRVRGFTGGYNWYPHSGPSPIDVLTLRLLAFITAPHEYPAYKALPSEALRNKAQAKVFEMLLRFHRGKGRYRTLGRVVSCLAGDSVRRAVQMARQIFESEAIRDDLPRITTIAADLKAVRARYEVRALMERLGSALFDDLVAIPYELELRSHHERAVEQVAQEIAERLSTVSLAVVRNAVRVDGSALLHVGADEMGIILSERDAGLFCKMQIENGSRCAKTVCCDRALPGGIVEIIADRARALLEATLIDRLTGLAWSDDAVPGILATFLASCLRFVEAGADDANIDDAFADDEANGFDEWDHAGVCRTILAANPPHEAVRSLLRSAQVLNLFHLGPARELTAGKLRLLYFAAFQSQGRLPLLVAIRDLKEFGYDEEQIREFINDLVSAERRLMWVDRNFGYMSWELLVKDPQRDLTMSRSGWGYHRTLLSDINYIAQMFSATRGVRNERNASFAEQLTASVRGLQALWADESQRLRDYRSRHHDARVPQDANCLERSSTSLDIATRCSWSTAETAKRYFKRLLAQNRRDDMDKTRAAVADWSRLIEGGYAELRQVAGGEEDAKVHLMPLLAARSLDPQHRWPEQLIRRRSAGDALRMLADVLKSDALWREGMPVDEFRA